MTEEKYKSFVQSQVKERAFEDLKNIQNEDSKVINILFENINKPQEYLTSKVFKNKTGKILFNRRCEESEFVFTNFTVQTTLVPFNVKTNMTHNNIFLNARN